MTEEKTAPQRLFFGLWPDAATRRRIAAVSGQFAELRGRPVVAGNLHLTLVFMGMLDADQRECAMAVADGISLPPFTLSFGHLGCWPRPRVLWLAPERSPATLAALVGQLQQGLKACGLAPEPRPWQPHITLRRKFSGALPALEIEPFGWPVRDFCLLQSVSGARGVSYRPLRCWELSAPGGGKGG